MKIIYTPNIHWKQYPPKIPGEANYLSLSGNNWDDAGYKTTLNATLFFEGEKIKLDFHLKLLIDGIENTADKLNELCSSGWNGLFPIPDSNYVSLPSDIDFYKTLISILGANETKQTLSTLRDAGLLKINNESRVNNILESHAFKISLLREIGAHKAYEDGLELLSGLETTIKNFTLFITCKLGIKKEIPFYFQDSLLPYDINVLIGSNGVGKSYCLKRIVSGWLQSDNELANENFNHRPNFSKLILISYSPFEEFNLEITDSTLLDKSAYKYFGFRQKVGIDSNGVAKIGINRNLPVYEASNSLIDAIYDDHKYSFINDRVNKLATAEHALKPALEYDYCAFEITTSSETEILIPYIERIDEKSYIKITSSIANLIDDDTLRSLCNLTAGIVFVKESKILDLSSGQRLFTYIVINVLGALKENSLVVIDEPELFLHPTLEIEFISLLKKILKPFRSKAILATHSLAVVREVPSKCTHIFKKTDGQLDIVPPPFETFGASVQRISSYVFGDRSVTKPFDTWINDLFSQQPNAEALIQSLGDEINEQLIMKILQLGRIKNGG